MKAAAQATRTSAARADRALTTLMERELRNARRTLSIAGCRAHNMENFMK
jgi:hypothetical protein